MKDKRAVVRRIVDRTNGRFNVAGAEVGAQDIHGRAVLGFAVVSEGSRHANEMLDRVVAYVGSLGLAPITRHETRLVHMGSPQDPPTLVPSRDVPSWDDYAETET